MDMREINIGVVLGLALGIVIGTVMVGTARQREINECREKYNVYACELKPAHNGEGE
jgi:hypothetical protein